MSRGPIVAGPWPDYRVYSADDSARIQQVLLYREPGPGCAVSSGYSE
ncbi:hypothetical protein [Brevibacterium yomogidense]|nr:hypothetical protein [Brevibacterium yomogidense]